MEHVVFCDKKEKALDKIINHERTMILRAAESRKIPHSRVFKGDKLYLTNKNSTTINYVAEVKDVYNYTKLPHNEVKRELMKFYKELNLSIKEHEKALKKCLCLIEIENVKKINSIKIKKQAPLIDWIILDDISVILDNSEVNIV